MPYPRPAPIGGEFVSIQDLGGPRLEQYGPWTNIVGAEATLGPVSEYIAPYHLPDPTSYSDALRRAALSPAPEYAPPYHPAYSDASRRAAWPRTRALIHSAIRETRDWDARGFANGWWGGLSWTPTAYVWGLQLDGSTDTGAAPSYALALSDMRDKSASGAYAVLAVFDKTSPHWPNPVTWHKSDAPGTEEAIAYQVSRHAPSAGVGMYPWLDVVNGEPWVSIVGQALDVLRRQAQVAAEEMPGRVIGVVRDANNQWALKSFRDADVADDWFGRVTRDKARFTYAAYFDKGDPMFPHPLNEEVGGARAPSIPPSSIPRVVAEVP